MEKPVTIIEGDNTYDISIKPGTTVKDVQKNLGLPKDNWLSKADGQPFGDTEDLYDAVKPGEKLYSSARASVARAC